MTSILHLITKAIEEIVGEELHVYLQDSYPSHQDPYIEPVWMIATPTEPKRTIFWLQWIASPAKYGEPSWYIGGGLYEDGVEGFVPNAMMY